MKIYLAGPDVFLPDRIEIGRRKTAICARYGLTGLYPLDHPVDLAADTISLSIFRGNEAMMDAADAIIANLTHFAAPARMPAPLTNSATWRVEGNFVSAIATTPPPIPTACGASRT